MRIECKNLSYIYGRGTPFEKVALDNINITIEDIADYKSIRRIPPGCGYCSGTDSNAASIPTAEQVRCPVDYKVYDN